MAEQAIVVEDLHKNFGALEVLKGISLQANEHDVVSKLWEKRWHAHLRPRETDAGEKVGKLPVSKPV